MVQLSSVDFRAPVGFIPFKAVADGTAEDAKRDQVLVKIDNDKKEMKVLDHLATRLNSKPVDWKISNVCGCLCGGYTQSQFEREAQEKMLVFYGRFDGKSEVIEECKNKRESTFVVHDDSAIPLKASVCFDKWRVWNVGVTFHYNKDAISDDQLGVLMELINRLNEIRSTKFAETYEASRKYCCCLRAKDQFGVSRIEVG